MDIGKESLYLFVLQNTKLNKFTRTILHQMDTTRKEIVDVRKQCDAINQSASVFKGETSKVSILNCIQIAAYGSSYL